MFSIDNDLTIHITRGDIAYINVSLENEGEPYKFKGGDIVRFKVFGKKDCANIVLQKDFTIFDESETAEIFLSEEDTKIGGVINKHTDYWYEIELNPDSQTQTVIGYDEDGAKIFRLYPEGRNISVENPDITPEDIPIIDRELDVTSKRPVENQAVAKVVINLTDRMTRVETSCNRLSNDIAELGVSINNIENDLSGKQVNISDLTKDVETVQSGMTELKTQTATNKNDIADLNTALATAESTITTVSSDLATARSNLQNATANISTIQTDIAEHESTLSTVKYELDAVEENLSNYKTEVSQALYNAHHIGSIYVTSTSANPSLFLDGTWELVDKEFSPHYGNDGYVKEAAASTPEYGDKFEDATDWIKDAVVDYARSGHSIYIRFTFTTDQPIYPPYTSSNIILGTLNMKKLGINGLCFAKHATGGCKNGMIRLFMWDNDKFSIASVVSPTGEIPENTRCVVEFTETTIPSYMENSACNKFYWKRTS